MRHVEMPMMPGGPNGPRDRMIRHAADLIGRRGVAATSVGEVIAASDAPRGSIYHHFPGGKTQLMSEAVRYAGDVIAERLGHETSVTASEAVVEVAGVWRRMLTDTDHEFGCPVFAACVAKGTEPAVAEEAEKIVSQWTGLVAARLVHERVDPHRADSLAALVIAAIEGAVGLCQARRSVQPLDQVTGEVAGLCASATT